MKRKKKTNKQDQKAQILEHCDGYAEVSDQSYQDTYFHIEKDEKILFPFFYHTVLKIEGFVQRCIINIRKDETLIVENGIKKTVKL